MKIEGNFRDSVFRNACAFMSVAWLVHAGHGKVNPDPEGTMNRIFKNNLKRRCSNLHATAPDMTPSNTEVTAERLPKQEIVKLAGQDGGTASRGNEFPVVIFRYREHKGLLDGNHRARAWRDENDLGHHIAYILTVEAAPTA